MAELKIHNGEFTLAQANQYIMDNVPYMEPNIDLQVSARSMTSFTPKGSFQCPSSAGR